MLSDHRLPLVSFTGSTAVGRRVAQVVAERFGRSLLELGGNNAIVVAADADLDMAVRAVLFGAVGTAGQRCTSTRRLIVHTDVIEPLAARLVAAYRQVPIGAPLDAGTLMGPLVSDAARGDDAGGAVAGGPRGRTGALRRRAAGPTSARASSSRRSSACRRRRRSSPARRSRRSSTCWSTARFDDAVALHNGVPQGLSSAIFTENVRTAEAFLSAQGSDCGIANVNIGTSGAEIGGAFGGEKDTGGGRESGSDAWKAYMRRQTNTVNWSSSLPLAQGIRFGD